MYMTVSRSGETAEPVELEVVAGVDDDREVDGARRRARPSGRCERQAVAQLGAAVAAGEHGHRDCAAQAIGMQSRDARDGSAWRRKLIAVLALEALADEPLGLLGFVGVVATGHGRDVSLRLSRVGERLGSSADPNPLVALLDEQS